MNEPPDVFSDYSLQKESTESGSGAMLQLNMFGE